MLIYEVPRTNKDDISDMSEQRWNDNYTKLHLWMLPFSKIIFMDSDMVSSDNSVTNNQVPAIQILERTVAKIDKTLCTLLIRECFASPRWCCSQSDTSLPSKKRFPPCRTRSTLATSTRDLWLSRPAKRWQRSSCKKPRVMGFLTLGSRPWIPKPSWHPKPSILDPRPSELPATFSRGLIDAVSSEESEQTLINHYFLTRWRPLSYTYNFAKHSVVSPSRHDIFVEVPSPPSPSNSSLQSPLDEF